MIDDAMATPGNGLILRAPRDEYEHELVRRFLHGVIRGWPYEVTLSETCDAEGRWQITLQGKDRPFDPLTFLSQLQVTGMIALCEHEYPASEYYRLAAYWEIPAQPLVSHGQSNIDFPPVIDWP